jgi:hypothetical protein
MKRLSLDDVEGVPVFGSLVWKPVRKTLDVTARDRRQAGRPPGLRLGVFLPLAAAHRRG